MCQSCEYSYSSDTKLLFPGVCGRGSFMYVCNSQNGERIAYVVVIPDKYLFQSSSVAGQWQPQPTEL